MFYVSGIPKPGKPLSQTFKVQQELVSILRSPRLVAPLRHYEPATASSSALPLGLAAVGSAGPPLSAKATELAKRAVQDLGAYLSTYFGISRPFEPLGNAFGIISKIPEHISLVMKKVWEVILYGQLYKA